MSTQVFGSDGIRRMNWYGLKRPLAKVLRYPFISRVAAGITSAVAGRAVAERLPVPADTVSYFLASGEAVTLHSPHIDNVAKYVYWGGGRITSPADARVLHFVEKYVNGIDDFIDIGAYTGLFTLVAGTANKRVRLHTFELVPENQVLLLANLVFNGLYERTRAHLVGLSRNAGSMRVQTALGMASLASSVSLGSSFESGIVVNLRRLDDFKETLGPRVAIKIDVEGFEHDVILGGRELIASRRPMIVCEILDTATGHLEIERFLTLHEYDFFLSTDAGFEKRDSIVPTTQGRDWVFMPRGEIPSV